MHVGGYIFGALRAVWTSTLAFTMLCRLTLCHLASAAACATAASRMLLLFQA
jgi:hypothetical protein